MADWRDELSSASAGLYLLVWQTPTDRALAGWTPCPGRVPGSMTSENLLHWLRDQVRLSGGEAGDVFGR